MLNLHVSILIKIDYTLCVWLISEMSWHDNILPFSEIALQQVTPIAFTLLTDR